MKEKSSTRLRRLLAQGKTLVKPGAHNALSARIIEQAGFPCCGVTGYGVSVSLLGRPDVGLTTMSEVVMVARYIAQAVDIPVIADADTGFGNAINVMRTVEDFIGAGAAAIHIEDQVAPKRCGHLPGSRPVIDLAEAAKKIEAAVAARTDPDFIIIARTDSAAGNGLDDAIKRVQTFRQAGADVLFVELKTSPTIIEDMQRITAEAGGPCLVNIDGGGKLGEMSAAEIGKLGFRIAIFPGLARNSAVFAIREAVNALKRDGNIRAVSDRMVTMKQYNEVLQLGDIEEWERKYLRT